MLQAHCFIGISVGTYLRAVLSRCVFRLRFLNISSILLYMLYGPRLGHSSSSCGAQFVLLIRSTQLHASCTIARLACGGLCSYSPCCLDSRIHYHTAVQYGPTSPNPSVRRACTSIRLAEPNFHDSHLHLFFLLFFLSFVLSLFPFFFCCGCALP